MKSRYQMTNRGSKWKPCWYVEDFDGVSGMVGKYLYSDSIKYRAEGFLKNLRASDRSTKAP